MKKPPRTDGFDSDEEIYFTWYLDELKANGYIREYRYHPPTYKLSEGQTYQSVKQLTTKLKYDDHTLLQSHRYTPDFMIYWTDISLGVFNKPIRSTVPHEFLKAHFWAHEATGERFSIIDVKPLFDMQNMTRQFIINQKILFEKWGVY